MGSHVHLQLRSLSETVSACLAFERFFVRVRSQVLQEVALERALTNGTLERFHAAVIAAQVFAQSIRAGERFAANRARVVPLSGMSSQVHLRLRNTLENGSFTSYLIDYFQVCRTGETLVALITLIRPFPRVSALMLQQLPASGEFLPAVAASVLLDR